VSVRDREAQVQEAERQLARHQQRINRPGATLEDELDYQRARTRLALAERDFERAARQADRKAMRQRKENSGPPERENRSARPNGGMSKRDRVMAAANAIFDLSKRSGENG
jgi:multidrug resistance efflux pump